MIIFINDETGRKLSMTHERFCGFTKQVAKTDFLCVSGIIEKFIYLYIVPPENSGKNYVFQFTVAQGFPRICDISIRRMKLDKFAKIFEKGGLTEYQHQDGIDTLEYLQKREA